MLCDTPTSPRQNSLKRFLPGLTCKRSISPRRRGTRCTLGSARFWTTSEILPFASYLQLKTDGLYYAFTQSRMSGQVGHEANLALTVVPYSEQRVAVEDLWNSLQTNASRPLLGCLTAIFF